MRVRTRFVTAAALSAALVLPLAAPAPGGAQAPEPTPRSTPPVDAAMSWLETQQEADGGFEVANFPGFETADAVLALAAAGQPDPGWDEADALSAVQAVSNGGKTGLDALDDLVDAPVEPAQAAKVIALDVVPLGLDAGDFDPSNDTEAVVDLLAIVQSAAGTGEYPDLAFGGRVFVAWALAALGETVPPALLAAIEGAQQANGSFHYSGVASGSGHDPDLTASVIIALTLAGRPVTDPTVRDAVVSLGLTQIWNGEWNAEFDTGNPNSTALVLQAAATLGTGSRATCWRDTAEIRFAGVPYPRPVRAIERRQLESGRVTSPNDGFGINTFATSQAIQGLAAAAGNWPYAPEGQCLVAPMVPDARRLVNAHYVDLLGRLSDEAGATFWASQVAGGMSAAQVAHRISGTSEYGQRVADSLYRRYLDRPATSFERDAAGRIVLFGQRLLVTTTILASDEYFDKAGPTNDPTTFDQWLDAVFRDLLGREPQEPDYGTFENSGWTRAQIVRVLLRQPEVLGGVVNDIYHQILRRDADAAGKAYWIGELRRGVSPERLVRLIAGSPEYVSSTRQGPI